MRCNHKLISNYKYSGITSHGLTSVVLIPKQVVLSTWPLVASGKGAELPQVEQSENVNAVLVIGVQLPVTGRMGVAGLSSLRSLLMS